MSVDVVTIMFIDTKEYIELFGDKKPEAGVMVIIVNKCRSVINEVLWSMFLEDSDNSLFCHTFIEENKKKTIKLSINLTENYYNKHFGNLLKEQREKELNKFIIGVTEELDKVDWLWYII